MMLHNEGGGLMAMVKPYAQEGKWNDQMHKKGSCGMVKTHVEK
jgi:hypothetical protein